MKKINLLSSAFLLTLTATQAFALQCPDKSRAPACPTSGTTLLDETYPTQSFVISNQPVVPSKESRRMTQQFVNKVIKNFDFTNVPQIILPITTTQEFDEIVANTRNFLTQKNVPAAEVEKIIGQLSHVPIQSYTWQQDWFESFVDVQTGSPVVRQIASYEYRVAETSAQSLTTSASRPENPECSISNGPIITSGYPGSIGNFLAVDVKADEMSFGSGEMGGNIEGAPGGFCMVGDNQAKSFTKQFCGDDANIIQLQTSWLSVGHVDEIFKIIPTQFNDGRPKECEFSLMAASPKKALSLMSNSQRGQAPFFNIETKDPDVDTAEVRSSRSTSINQGNKKLCTYILDIVKNRSDGGVLKVPAATKSVLLRLFFNITKAQADEVDFIKNPETLAVTCGSNLDRVTNFEMQEIMQLDPAFVALNNTIDESIQADKAKIKNSILSRLPQCAAYYDEMDVPDLFVGSAPILNPVTNKLELPKPGTIDSFLPNPTNSVLMNKTVTFPDSNNGLFNQYLTEELEKRKMKSDFISSWDYAHLGMGNIHCSSHSLPYCRPQPTQRSN